MPGRIFRRGARYWIAYCVHGKEHRESSRSTSFAVAKALLVSRLVLPSRTPPSVVTVAQLLDGVHRDYVLHQKPSLRTFLYHQRVLSTAVGHYPAHELTLQKISELISRWRNTVTDTTINHRLKTLRRAYRLAVRHGVLPTLPVHIPTISECPPRSGFFSPAQFVAVRNRIPDRDVQDYLDWAYWTGQRRGEISQLTWDMIDEEAHLLLVPSRVVKTRRGRVLPLVGPLAQVVERRRAVRHGALIFHRAGAPVLRFDKLWRAACAAAGVPGRTVHDLRRTALRNLIRAGVDRTIAMTISGHTTAAVFDRYQITSTEDVAQAFERVATFVLQTPLVVPPPDSDPTGLALHADPMVLRTNRRTIPVSRTVAKSTKRQRNQVFPSF